MTKERDDKGRQLFHCPVEATMSKIGGKYKAILIYHLSQDGVLRFSQLQRLVPQATPKMLTQQLRELESDGFVHREVYPVVPPKTEYSLTEEGKTLAPIVQAMCDWGSAHMADQIVEPAEH
ncbi:MAG: winged helix-turn-helix transcriptional regulator [Coriobacteriales bacterium]|jgi:DNA-binding HxlR family transcriptional regulator